MTPFEVDFRFPVLGVSTGNDLWGFPDLRGLTTCGPRTLKDGMQLGMELIDLDGRRWSVKSVRRLKRAGAFPFRWLGAILYGAPGWRVEQELEPLEPVTLDRVKNLICDAMQAHPDFWCDESEFETVLPRRLAEIRAAEVIADIHELLGLDTFEAY